MNKLVVYVNTTDETGKIISLANLNCLLPEGLDPDKVTVSRVIFADNKIHWKEPKSGN